MSGTLKQIRAGLATNIGAIPDIQVSAYMLSSPTPPMIYIFPDETDFDLAMGRGLDLYRLTIQAMVGFVADEAAQAFLDTLLDPADSTSVKAAAESDKTLGGVVQDLRITKQTGYRLYEVPNVGRGMSSAQIIGAEWTAEVYV